MKRMLQTDIGLTLAHRLIGEPFGENLETRSQKQRKEIIMEEKKNENGSGTGNGGTAKNGCGKKNSFNKVLDSLMEGACGVITSKTVVGEPITIGDTIIIPLSDVSIGVGAGSNGTERRDSGMGGFSAKMTPTAVLVIKDDMTKVVNIKDQTTLTHIIDMVPEIIDRIRSRDREMISDEAAVSAAFPEKAKETK